MSTTQLELFREDWRLIEKVSARARNIRIEVCPRREVRLVYPRWVARDEALAFLRARDGWIRAKLAELAAREARSPVPPPARWDGSDEILWQGCTVPVCVEPATLRQIQVRIEPQVITVFAPPSMRGQPSRLEQALRRELMRCAALEGRRLLEREALPLGVQWRGPRIADPQTQWGSCGADGWISLSWRLVMAPPAVFRYVVIHELCHRVHMDHSERFWSLVAQRVPDYLTHKAWLRDHGQRLHHYLRRARPGQDGAIPGADFQ